jgi:hypothetical protein
LINSSEVGGTNGPATKRVWRRFIIASVQGGSNKDYTVLDDSELFSFAPFLLLFVVVEQILKMYLQRLEKYYSCPEKKIRFYSANLPRAQQKHFFLLQPTPNGLVSWLAMYTTSTRDHFIYFCKNLNERRKFLVW